MTSMRSWPPILSALKASIAANFAELEALTKFQEQHMNRLLYISVVKFIIKVPLTTQEKIRSIESSFAW
jgi:hypothetical protein